MNDKIIETLNRGGLVVYPTDTVYGLLCDASNGEAVKKLINFKQRPAGKPISIFVCDLEMAKQYVKINVDTEKRLRTLLPGPYTIVLPSKHKLPAELESEKGTLGIRIPDNKEIIDLVNTFGKPLTATSANLAGRPPHYSIKSFNKQVAHGRKNLVDFIVDGGDLPHNKPSTVVDFTTGDLKVLRDGDQKVTSFTLHVSKSEVETKKFAHKLLQEELNRDSKKPIIFILKGDLGAGKTIFTKGLGEALGISNIISPTFVVYYEYPILLFRNNRIFVHVDLYNLSDKEEFKHLGLEKYLVPGNIMCIEWGEKAGEIIEDLKDKATLIYVYIRHKSETERTISVNF
ncbi:MAG: L-threonylcarbamoyladenylate synthase [Microgenomates group bacterium]